MTDGKNSPTGLGEVQAAPTQSPRSGDEVGRAVPGVHTTASARPRFRFSKDALGVAYGAAQDPRSDPLSLRVRINTVSPGFHVQVIALRSAPAAPMATTVASREAIYPAIESLSGPLVPRSPHPACVTCGDCLHHIPASVPWGIIPARRAPGGCSLDLTNPQVTPPRFPCTGHFCHAWWPARVDCAHQPPLSQKSHPPASDVQAVSTQLPRSGDEVERKQPVQQSLL
jgi:hypothetical protein